MDGTMDIVAEDLCQAVRSGREVRRHCPYRVLIGDEALQFEPRVIADPVPTGTQILEAAGVTSPTDYVSYRIIKSGLLEEL